jgi:TonB family protein
MSAFAAWASACFLNALWQVALIFCAAWMAARLVRRAGPRAEHGIWVAALLLESLLPFCRLHPERWLHRLLVLLQGQGSGSAGVRIQVDPVALAVRPWLPAWAQCLLALLFLLAIVAAALRLAWNLWRTRQLLLRASNCAPAEPLASLLSQFASVLGVSLERVRILLIENLNGPATIGLRTHWILLPTGLLPALDDASQLALEERDELAATLAHELVHIRRRDFALNLVYEILALVVAWHPLSQLTRVQLSESRELAADAEAARLLQGHRTYARSLVRLAARIAARPLSQPLPAVGIYGSNIFERRIAHLMHNAPQSSLLRRSLLLAGSAAILLATCYTAMALQTDVQPSSDQKPTHVMISPGIAAGNLVSKVTPIYPPEAKKAGISGTVVLDAEISKAGFIENLHVVSGPPELLASAMEAVRQWVYKPYLLNGNPVEVETRINVIYTLAGKPPAAPAEPAGHTEASALNPAAAGQTPPVALSMPEAVFPPEAKEKHLDGIVVVRLNVDAEGHPTVLDATGPEVFLKPAREAVEKAAFKPATRDGQPVEAIISVEVNFKHY